MSEFVDAYEVLGVDPDCSQAELKAAHRRLVRRHHPDLALADERQEATRRVQRINMAYALVGEPAQRARYDAIRRTGALTGSDPWHHDADLAAEWEALVVAAGRWAARLQQRASHTSAPDLAHRLGRAVGRLAQQRHAPRG